MWHRAPPDLKSRKHFICKHKTKTASESLSGVKSRVYVWVTKIKETYWQFGERRVADMSTEHLLLELEQLDHQAGQGLVGGGLSLDVLRGQQHRAEPQRGHKINYSVLIGAMCGQLWRVQCYLLYFSG